MKHKIIMTGNLPVIIFIVQVTQVWNSRNSIYYKCIENNFDTYILAVPENLEIPETNPAFDFCNSFANNVICAYNQTEKSWFDLKLLKPDYVIYERPFPHYLPTLYHPKFISSYSQICCIPYAHYFFETTYRAVFDKEFYLYCSMIFVENMVTYNFLNKKLNIAIKNKILSIYNFGNPRLDAINAYKSSDENIWNYMGNQKRFRIMWTPRWTENPELMGSSFREIKDKLIQYIKGNDFAELVFRPHPLLFQVFVNNGIISEEELEKYQNEYKQISNAQIDLKKDYYDSFFSSDVLLTDFSSIILEYFWTKKPIILFCKNNKIPDIHNIDEDIKNVLNGLYLINSWDEAKTILEELRMGKDEKKEIREYLIDTFIKNYQKSVADLIVMEIRNNYKTLCKRGDYSE